MSLGRNEPCHCGSGKKYKKCCLRKDEEKTTVQHQHSNSLKKDIPKVWENNEKWENDEFLDSEDDLFNEEEYNDDENFEQENVIEGYKETEFDDYPTLAKKDDKKIDDWFNIYENIENPDVILEHLKKFLNEEPLDLIINLGLEEDVLFELIDKFHKAGKTDEILEFILDFRLKYPEVYQRSAGYYDSDIIAWLISKNETDRIENYLNYFEKYPVNYIDELFKTINLLICTDNSDKLIQLTSKIYKGVLHSRSVMGGYEIAHIPINEVVLKYLKKDYNKTSFENLGKELKELELDYHKDFYEPSTWETKFKAYYKDYTAWEEKIPNSKQKFYNNILLFSENYLRYLTEEKKLNYHTAFFYGSRLSSFYSTLSESEFRPKSFFIFTKQQIDSIITKLSKDFMGINIVDAMTYINTLYYFAEYLVVCNNYTKEQKDNLQEILQEFHSMLYKSYHKIEIEALCFKEFPLFG